MSRSSLDLRPLHEHPHHDGGPACVDQGPHRAGDRVEVLLVSPVPLEQVWVRTVEDGEPFFVAATEESPGRWRGQVHVANPVQRYRFLLVAGAEQSWLNAAGWHDHDMPDAGDFTLTTAPPAPGWGLDTVVYQVFPDRFARSAAADEREQPAWAVPAAWDDDPVHVGPDTPLQLYGGDLDGVVEHLDHLTSLGVGTLYLTPVFPGESNHRYNASTFDAVDPLLGGDAAYRRLIDAAHDLGLRVVGDLTSNHTGDTHEWFVRALADPTSPERGFYFFAADGSHEGWKGHDTLPKLDHTNPEVRARVEAVVRRWLEAGLDGWRIDVANMTGRRGAVDVAHDVARGIRAAATGVRPDALVLAEHGHDASGDVDGDGWHGTMSYYGFSFPVWEWLRRPGGEVPSFGRPVGLPRRSGPQVVATMRDFAAHFGWRGVLGSWNILSSHDTPRIRTVCGSAERHHAAVAMQFTLPGVPMVFAGDELGLEGTDGEDSRRTMPWDTLDPDHPTIRVYRSWAGLRGSCEALRRGGLRWLHVDDDVLAYARSTGDSHAVVVVSRGGSPAFDLPVEVPVGLAPALGAGPAAGPGGIAVPAMEAPQAVAWTW